MSLAAFQGAALLGDTVCKQLFGCAHRLVFLSIIKAELVLRKGCPQQSAPPAHAQPDCGTPEHPPNLPFISLRISLEIRGAISSPLAVLSSTSLALAYLTQCLCPTHKTDVRSWGFSSCSSPSLWAGPAAHVYSWRGQL